MSNPSSSNSVDLTKIDWESMPARAFKVITAPEEFFRSMPKVGGFLDPLAFVIVVGVLSGLIHSLIFFLGFDPLGSLAMALGSIIVAPIFIAIFSFISAAIFFVIWKIMGSKEEFETVYRCLAYGAAITPIVTVLNAIPYLPVLGIVWWLYLLVSASVQVHRIAARTAWFVFGIPAALFMLVALSAQYAAYRTQDYFLGVQRDAEKLQRNLEQGNFREELERMRKQTERQ